MCWLGRLKARARGAERGSLVARADFFGRQWGMRLQCGEFGNVNNRVEFGIAQRCARVGGWAACGMEGCYLGELCGGSVDLLVRGMEISRVQDPTGGAQ